MPDQEDPDRPGYDWLYSSGGRRSSDAADPDATQAMPPDFADPAASRALPPDTPDPEATQAMRPDTADPEATQAMRPDTADPDAPRAMRPDPADPDATQAMHPDAGVPRSSFGGTYSQPAPSSPRAAQSAAPVSPRPPARSPMPPARPPASGAYRARQAPRSRRNWWLRSALLLLAAWVIFLVAVPVWAWSAISKVDAEPAGPRPANAAGTTYLLVGSDSRAGLTTAQKADLGTGAAAGQRTDTIILLEVPAHGPDVLLSIPRDSYVDIPGHGRNKINAAYAIGGPGLLVHTVEQATKVHVDNYIEIGFAGFVDVVDAVGGIQVCPKTSIDDRKAGRLHMSKGCQHVDGHTALSYSRSRAFPNGDITRALHQREVIGAVGAQAASWKTVVLPWRYFRLNSATAKTVRIGTDVSPIDVLRFSWAMAHVGGSGTKRCVVPYSSLGTATSAGSAVIWDDRRANALFAKIRSGDTSSVHCAPQ